MTNTNLFFCILIRQMKHLKKGIREPTVLSVDEDHRVNTVENMNQNTHVRDWVPASLCTDVLQNTLDIIKHHREN